jgi:triosephosphate isomerase
MNPWRTTFIAGNWKMYNTIAEAEQYARALLPKVASANGVEIGICVPFLALAPTIDATRGSRVEVFAQTMHQADEGAFTGEVSPPMLTEIGVHGVVLGHSERRQLFGETDGALRLKVPAALQAGLVPILCVGETEEERARGDTERKLRRQVQEGLEKVPVERLPEVVLAYEPIWAIGTGLTATPEQAQETVAYLRALVQDIDHWAGQQVRVLYGGSLKPENAEELLRLPAIDGALVGGASLDPESFAHIVEVASGLAAAAQ